MAVLTEQQCELTTGERNLGYLLSCMGVVDGIQGNMPVWAALRLTTRRAAGFVTIMLVPLITYHYVFVNSFGGLIVTVGGGILLVVCAAIVTRAVYGVFCRVCSHFAYDGPDSPLASLYVRAEDAQKFSRLAMHKLFYCRFHDVGSLVCGVLVYALVTGSSVVSHYMDTGDVVFSLFEWGNTFVFPWTIPVKVCNWVLYGAVVVIIISLLRTIRRCVVVVDAFNEEQHTLVLFQLVEELNEVRVLRGARNLTAEDELKEYLFRRSHFTEFYEFARGVVDSMIRITAIIFVSGILMSLVNVAIRLTEGFSQLRFYMGLVVVGCGLLLGLYVFVHPQLRMHALMEAYKSSMVNLLQDVFELQIHRFMVSEKSIRREVATDIRLLDEILEYNKQLRVWPYTPQHLIQVASLATLVMQSGLFDALQAAMIGG